MVSTCSTSPINDYATLAPQFICADTPIPKVAEIMRAGGFRHLPVLEGNRIVGMISDRDVRVLAYASGLDAIVAGDIMAKDPYVVPSGTPVAQVAATMIERNIGSAIIEINGVPIGIFTATDALRAIAGDENTRTYCLDEDAGEDENLAYDSIDRSLTT